MSKKYNKTIPQKNANKPTKTAYEIKEQTAYFVKNRLPAFILAGFMIFWTIAGIFGIVAYARGNTRKSAMVTASAQTAEQYDYAVYEVELTGLNGVGFYPSAIGDYAVIADNPKLVFNGNNVYWNYGDSRQEVIENYTSIGVSFLGISDHNATTIDLNCDTNQFDTWYDSSRYIPYSIEYTYSIDSNTDRFKIDISVLVKDRGADDTPLYVMFTLSDICDEHYIFCPYTGESLINEYRTISYETECLGVDIYTAWEWWQRYKAPSYNDGYNAGYNKGYGEGKIVGYNNGKSVGYYEGVQEANDYSFTGLLAAVFDVPVQTFTSIFNFDLLGVNLANFFYSLLTLAVILAVVKLIL